jgi:hypothetical protein
MRREAVDEFVAGRHGQHEYNPSECQRGWQWEPGEATYDADAKRQKQS